MRNRSEVLNELNTIDRALDVLNKRKANAEADITVMTVRRENIAAELEMIDEVVNPQPFYAR